MLELAVTALGQPAPVTPGLTRVARCLVCRRSFEQAARACGPFLTCSPECRKLRIRRQKRDAKRRQTTRRHVELLRVLPDDGGKGPFFSLTPAELADLLEARGRGWASDALAVRFGVSERTVQRALRLSPPAQVTVGRYSAWFAAQQVGAPVQLTPWMRDMAGRLRAQGE